MLAASLSFAGFLGYVGIYTIWLKRRTPQNIVIGGAAGAVPPLVGWAAVTGHVERDGGAAVLHRLLLDAAALLGAEPADEGRVREGRSADDARRARRGRDPPADPALHVLLYAVTQLPFCAGGFGVIYLVVLDRARAWASSPARSACTGGPTAAAPLQLYLFSLAYLALLFCAMVVDAHL